MTTSKARQNKKTFGIYKVSSTTCRWSCAYCGLGFHGCGAMQRHMARETCLPTDSDDRWIIKFLAQQAGTEGETAEFLSKPIDKAFEGGLMCVVKIDHAKEQAYTALMNDLLYDETL